MAASFKNKVRDGDQLVLPHGGRLIEAASQFNISLSRWLDLSTGINPKSWPVPKIPLDAWARLPEEGDGLAQAAQDYYGTDKLLAVAGSQAAIQAIPHLFKPCRVGVLTPSYNEHAHAWKKSGHQLCALAAADIDAAINRLSVLVLVNPNNPSAQQFVKEQILEWHARLSSRNGIVVVDEAFIDTDPTQSLVEFAQQPGLIVLRSLGKFFGLAGARVGFVFAECSLLQRLQSILGPWPIAAPSRWVAMQALRDQEWQHATRIYLLRASNKLARLLSQHGLPPTAGTALFQWVIHQDSDEIYMQLAKQGILLRRFAQPLSLRFGLPSVASDWRRLQNALQGLALNA